MPSDELARGSSAVLVAVVLVSLLASAATPSVIAYEVKNLNETEVNRGRRISAAATRMLESAADRHVLAEAPLEAAIRTLFCLELRQAVDAGRLDRQGQEWILTKGHRCRDDWLLFDALGF